MGLRSRSSVKRLPDELRKAVDALLAEGKYSLDEVLAHVRSLGANVSRSALGRYSQSYEDVAKDIRLTREMATAIGKDLATTDGDAGRLVIESLQALLLRARTQLSEGDTLDAQELGALARAAKDLQSALRANVETELRIRQTVLRDAAEAATKAAAARGLTADTVADIKASILGVEKRA